MRRKITRIRTSSFCPWNSNFLGIMNAVWLNSKNRCLSTPESIADTTRLIASRPACMELIRPSSAEVCIFRAFVTQWWNPKSMQSIRSDRSSTKYLCTVLLVASKHKRYSLRAFNAFSLASKYLFFLWNADIENTLKKQKSNNPQYHRCIRVLNVQSRTNTNTSVNVAITKNTYNSNY